MAIEAARSLPGQPDMQRGRIDVRDLPPMPASQLIRVDKILQEDPNVFMTFYRRSSEFPYKLLLAEAMILDPRIQAGENGYNAADLLTNFANFDSIPEHSRGPVEEMRKAVQVLLAGNGIKDRDNNPIAPLSEDETEKAISKIIEIDPYLNMFAASPELAPVVGAIASGVLFGYMTDEGKQDWYANLSTRAVGRLRPYLGDITVHKSRKEFTGARAIMEKIPDIYFDVNTVVANIIRHQYESEVLKLYNEGYEKGSKEHLKLIEAEEQPFKRKFLERIFEDMQAAIGDPIADYIRDSIPGVYADREVPFPHPRQRYIVHEFANPERNKYAQQHRMLLNGGTASGKTAMSILGMENAGAKKVVVVAPSGVQGAWKSEIAKLYKDETDPDQQLFILRKAKQLLDPEALEEMKKRKYVFIGAGLLSDMTDEEFNNLQNFLTETRGSDGVTIDECHNFRKIKNTRTKRLVELVRKIEDYQLDTNKKAIPIWGLSATPFVTSKHDYNVIMSILYRNKYGIFKENGHQDEQPLFHIACKNDEHTIFTKLFGERLMMQVSTQDMFEDDVPIIDYEIESLPIGAYEKYIYDWVYAKSNFGGLDKTSILRSITLDPKIIVDRFNEIGEGPKTKYTQEQVLSMLNNYYQKWTSEKPFATEEVDFDFDWISQNGGGEMLLHVLFDRQNFPDGLVDFLHDNYHFQEGLENLIAEKWWNKRHSMPRTAKYRYIYDLIMENFDKPRSEIKDKLFLISPFREDGITSSKGHWSLYESIQQWLDYKFTEKEIRAISGKTSMDERSDTGETWRTFGAELPIALGTAATKEGIDLAIRATENTKNVERVFIILLDWPWGHSDILQFFGRFFRPGMNKNFEFVPLILETEGTTSEGMSDLVHEKQLRFLMTQYGYKPTAEDIEFLKEQNFKDKLERNYKSRRDSMLRYSMRELKGAGEDFIIDTLSKDRDGKSGFERFIKEYLNDYRDQLRIVGNNARMTVNILEEVKPESVLDIGAGSCLLGRTIDFMGQHKPKRVVNMDLNHYAMEEMKKLAPEIGEFAVGRASNLRKTRFLDNSSKVGIAREEFDAVNMAFMLDWTKLNMDAPRVIDIERVKVLTEANRVLKTNGTMVITLAESTFKDSDQFKLFVETLRTHFGFSVDEAHTGFAHSQDQRPNKRIGWCITLKKVGEVTTDGLNPENLMFATDPVKIVSTYKKREPKRRSSMPTENIEFLANTFVIRGPYTELPTVVAKALPKAPPPKPPAPPVATPPVTKTQPEVQQETPQSPSTEPLPQVENEEVTIIVGDKTQTIPGEEWKNLVTSLKHRFESEEAASTFLLSVIKDGTKINGNASPDPAYYKYILDINSSNAGRMNDARMDKIRRSFNKKTWRNLAIVVQSRLQCDLFVSDFILATILADEGLREDAQDKYAIITSRFGQSNSSLEDKLAKLIDERIKVIGSYVKARKYDIISHIFDTNYQIK